MDDPPFLRFMAIPELADMVAANLNMADLGSLQGACRLCRELRPDINRRLRRFVSNPTEFRSLQAETHVLISGTFVLSFVEAHDERVSTPEIFCHQDYAKRWRQYLEKEGYKAKILKGRNGRPEITTFRRTDVALGRENVIRLFIKCALPLSTFLEETKLSPLFNIMTWDRVYSLLPKPLFQEHLVYTLTENDDQDFIKTLSDLENYGWRLQHFLTKSKAGTFQMTPGDNGNAGSWPSLRRQRRVGDKASCIMPLYTEGVAKGLPDHVIELCEFTLTLRSHYGFWDLDWTEFNHPLLKHDYITGNPEPFMTYQEAVDEGFDSILQEVRLMHLDLLLPWECRKYDDIAWIGGTDPVSHPYEADTFDQKHSLVEVPDKWSFVDDHLPVWHQNYEKKREGARLVKLAKLDAERDASSSV